MGKPARASCGKKRCGLGAENSCGIAECGIMVPLKPLQDEQVVVE